MTGEVKNTLKMRTKLKPG